MDYLKEQLPGLDFTEEITKNPKLEEFIKKECENYEMEFVHPLRTEEAPQLNTNVSNYFLLCGLPKVDEEKKEKLLKVLLNIFTKKNIDFIKQENITILLNNATGESYGTAFIECENPKQAKQASAAIHNFALGKANTIMSSTFDEFDRLTKVPDEYQPPKFADLEDLNTYAMDPSNDQFLIREDNNVIIKWNKSPTKADKNASSPDFHKEIVGPNSEIQIKSNRNAQWSPQGRYLIVFKENIVQLYGGSGFDLIREILHSDVSQAFVSPCERYIITYSKEADEKEGNYNFWRIDTGELLRSFAFDENTPKTSAADVFSFSYDGNYCAKMIKDHVAVYQLPDMHLLEDANIGKRVSIRIDHIKSFQWNPARNMFCYWFHNEESELHPPKIGFIDIPSREVWSEKEIINGEDIKAEWSADGTKLIAICKLKIKKAHYNNVTVFDVTSRFIPMDIIKVDTNIMCVEWTSATSRLAILTNKEKKIREKWEEFAQPAFATIYDVKQDKGALISTPLGKTKDQISNNVKWAQNGHLFIVSDIKNTNSDSQGNFFVYYVRTVISKVEIAAQGKNKKKKGKPQFEEKREYLIESVNEIEDPRCDALVWDPTGRYFVTSKLPKGKFCFAVSV